MIPPARGAGEGDPTRAVRRLAALVAAAVGIAFPAGYAALSYQHTVAELKADAEITARLLTRFINSNPDIWAYKQHDLEQILDQTSDHGAQEPRAISSEEGGLVLTRPGDERWPVVVRSAPLFDAGSPAGRVEVRRTVRPLAWRTALVSLAGLALGLLVYGTLSVFPLRALRRALASLHDEKERAQVTLRSIADGVIATDRQGRVAMMNQAAEDLTGWRQEEAAGRPLAQVFRLKPAAEGRPAVDPAALVLGTGEVFEPPDPGVLVSASGREHVVSDVGAPIRDAQDRVIGAVLVFRDVTERRRAEAELVRMDKLESIGVLAGGIAHDFNNLLTAILNNLELGHRRADPGSPVRAVLDKAESAALRARHLTQQLLTFSKGGAPVRRPVALRALVEEAARFSLSGSAVDCSFSLPDDLWPVEADEGQVTQVLGNLVLNAAQASRHGHTIRVSCANLWLDAGQHATLGKGRYVTVTVEDQGVGIPRENLRKIFDPYFSTKGGGSGLGLATAFSIVKSHGGHVAVASEVGRGSAFTVYLPASEQAPPVAVGAGPLDPGRGRLLLMDDEAGVREATGELLELLGYTVTLAADGAEAVRLYARARDEGLPFDAVLMDLTIPGGMGGKEAIVRLRALDPGVRAVVSSGYSNDPVMADCRRYGFDAVLGKPYRLDDLSRVLQATICRATRAAEA